MLDFIKTFGLPIIMFLVLGWATLEAQACGGDDAVYPETVEVPTFLFIK